MSLVSDLRDAVVASKELVSKLPVSVQRRRLEQAFSQVSLALERLNEDSVTDVVKESTKATPEEELVPLGSTTPFSDEDVDRIYNGEQPEG